MRGIVRYLSSVVFVIGLIVVFFGFVASTPSYSQDCSQTRYDSHLQLQTTQDAIYFVTNRTESGNSFGNELGPIHYGSVAVSFSEPPHIDHFFADMEGALQWKIGDKSVLTASGLITKVSQHVNSGKPLDPMRPTDSVIVYIHGFADDFQDALCRAAEIKHRARFEGSVVLFSWPASASLSWDRIMGAYKEYDHDRANANDVRTISALVEFLNALRQQVPARRTVLVAHSMGNQLLMKAIKQLSTNNSDLYRAVVMLAPDLSTKDLSADLTDLALRTKRAALYVNTDDRALKVSSFKNGGERAGATDLVDPNGWMETVDITLATKKKGDWIHHADHLDGTALYDLFWNIVRDMPAECREERGLGFQAESQKPIWKLNVSDNNYDVRALKPSCRLPTDRRD